MNLWDSCVSDEKWNKVALGKVTLMELVQSHHQSGLKASLKYGTKWPGLPGSQGTVKLACPRFRTPSERRMRWIWTFPCQHYHLQWSLLRGHHQRQALPVRSCPKLLTHKLIWKTRGIIQTVKSLNRAVWNLVWHGLCSFSWNSKQAKVVNIQELQKHHGRKGRRKRSMEPIIILLVMNMIMWLIVEWGKMSPLY